MFGGISMALIKCPECGKEISDKADKCINCGYPIANQSKKFNPVVNHRNSNKYSQRNIIVISLLSVVIIVVGVILFLNMNQQHEITIPYGLNPYMDRAQIDAIMRKNGYQDLYPDDEFLSFTTYVGPDYYGLSLGEVSIDQYPDYRFGRPILSVKYTYGAEQAKDFTYILKDLQSKYGAPKYTSITLSN